MASGKNDVIKLLPALTVSETEVRQFLTAFEAVLADLHGPANRNWGEVRQIATTTLRRQLSREVPHASAAAPPRGTPIDPARGDEPREAFGRAVGAVGGEPRRP